MDFISSEAAKAEKLMPLLAPKTLRIGTRPSYSRQSFHRGVSWRARGPRSLISCMSSILRRDYECACTSVKASLTRDSGLTTVPEFPMEGASNAGFSDNGGGRGSANASITYSLNKHILEYYKLTKIVARLPVEAALI